MVKLETIKDSIHAIAGRPKNVTASEIEKLCEQLKQHGYSVSIRTNVHAKLITINGLSFSICTHNRGSKQIKQCYVTGFLRIMIELELYDKS